MNATALQGAMSGVLAGVADSRWTLAVGAALIHFVWEAGLVALAVAAVQPWLRRASAKTRYGVSCAALFSLPAIFVATVVWAHMGSGAEAALDVWLAGRLTAWLPAITGAWILGVVVSAVYAGGGWMWLRRVRQEVTAAVPEAWRQALARMTERMGMSAQAQMALSAAVDGPCVVGWWRPLILMPVSAVAAMPMEHVEALLAHELAHIRRHDYLVNLAQRGVEVMFFFHPAVWWLGRQVAQEREQCCDDDAIAVCGNRVGYARALVELAGQAGAIGAAPREVCAAHGGSLRRRVQRIVSGEAEFGWGAGPGRGRAALGMLLGAALTLGMIVTLNVGAAGRRPEAVRGLNAAKYTATPRLEKAALRLPVERAKMPPRPRMKRAVVVTSAVLKRPVTKRPVAPAAMERAAIATGPVPQKPAARPRRQIVTVEYAAFESCGPTLALVQHMTPTGEMWTSLEPVVRCVPVIQPIGISVSHL